MCVCVFIHLFKIYLQQQFVSWRATSTDWPSPHDHPSRPLLDGIEVKTLPTKALSLR